MYYCQICNYGRYVVIDSIWDISETEKDVTKKVDKLNQKSKPNSERLSWHLKYQTVMEKNIFLWRK